MCRPEGSNIFKVLKGKKLPKIFYRARLTVRIEGERVSPTSKSKSGSLTLNWPYKKYFRKSFKLKRKLTTAATKTKKTGKKHFYYKRIFIYK